MEIIDDLFPSLSYAELKFPEKGGLRDSSENWSYRGGSVLRARSSFWNGSEVAKTFSYLDTCRIPVRDRF